MRTSRARARARTSETETEPSFTIAPETETSFFKKEFAPRTFRTRDSRSDLPHPREGSLIVARSMRWSEGCASHGNAFFPISSSVGSERISTTSTPSETKM